MWGGWTPNEFHAAGRPLSAHPRGDRGALRGGALRAAHRELRGRHRGVRPRAAPRRLESGPRELDGSLRTRRSWDARRPICSPTFATRASRRCSSGRSRARPSPPPTSRGPRRPAGRRAGSAPPTPRIATPAERCGESSGSCATSAAAAGPRRLCPRRARAARPRRAVGRRHLPDPGRALPVRQPEARRDLRLHAGGARSSRLGARARRRGGPPTVAGRPDRAGGDGERQPSGTVPARCARTASGSRSRFTGRRPSSRAGPPCIGTLLDITDRKRDEAQIAEHAFHDPLTKLPNRVRFIERLELELAQARRQSASVAVIYCDLDSLQVRQRQLGPQRRRPVAPVARAAPQAASCASSTRSPASAATSSSS